MSMMHCKNCDNIWDSDLEEHCPVCLPPTLDELQALCEGIRKQLETLREDQYYACLSDNFAHTNGTFESYQKRIRALQKALRETEAEAERLYS